jgi:hypothetical protein
LLVVDVGAGAAADCGIRQLGQKGLALLGAVTTLTGAGDSPAAIKSFDAIHYSSLIFGKDKVGAGQLLKRSETTILMKDGREPATAQQIGQLARIDAIALAATTVIFARIADQNLGYTRLQQSNQPRGRGAFFECDMQLAAQQLEQFQHSGSAGGDDTL